VHALAQAVIELVETAPLDRIKAALRALLTDEAAPGRRAAVESTPAPRADKRRQRYVPRPPTSSPEWDALRAQDHAAMKQRGVSYEELATVLNMSTTTVRIRCGGRRIPSQPMLQGLRAWLDAAAPATEVASSPVVFRHGRNNGTSGHATAA
jgi:hypothetical protein